MVNVKVKSLSLACLVGMLLPAAGSASKLIEMRYTEVKRVQDIDGYVYRNPRQNFVRLLAVIGNRVLLNDSYLGFLIFDLKKHRLLEYTHSDTPVPVSSR